MADFLLIGGRGFLGKSFVDWASSRGHFCEAIDIDDVDVANEPDKLAEMMSARPCFNVMLLASQVGAKLFETSPVGAWIQNQKMLTSMLYATQTAGMKPASVSWFSTSEVYGSNRETVSSAKSKPDIDTNYSRSLYAQCKLAGETAFSDMLRRGYVKKLRIFRPFNVFGPHQKRGVVYDMVQSALQTGVIRYAADTDRTLTPADEFAKQTCQSILSSESFATVDVSQPAFSTTMKLLAETVASVLCQGGYTRGVKLRECPPDIPIRHRHTGRVHWLLCPRELRAELEKTVAAIAEASHA